MSFLVARAGLIITFVISLTSRALPAIAQEAKPAWQQEWERTVREAEGEAKLSVAILRGDNREEAIRTFQKRYPKVRLDLQTVSVADYAARIMAERRAGKYLLDVCICGTTTPYRVFYGGKILDPIKELIVLPDVLDESKWWSGKHHYIDAEKRYIFVFLGNVMSGVVSYNTSLVNAQSIKSFWDLLHPRWKGRLLVRDPRAPGAGAGSMRWIYYHSQLGPEFIRKLFTEMQVILTRDDFQAIDWVAKGKSAICLFCRADQVTKAQVQGLPVQSFQSSSWKEGSGINVSFGTLSFMNRAPHPHAAKLFINWFLSREGQMAFQEVMNRPPTTSESLRIDIPNDMIPSEERRVKGVLYLLVDRPEWMDMKPIYDLVDQALKEREASPFGR